MSTIRTRNLVRPVSAATLFFVCLCGSAAADTPPRYDHVVIVMEENHDASEVMPDPSFAALARQGVLLTDFHAITHPSQPNYIALFSGSTRGVEDDDSYDLAAPNLALSLRAAGLGLASYSQSLPAFGTRVEEAGAYERT